MCMCACAYAMPHKSVLSHRHVVKYHEQPSKKALISSTRTVQPVKCHTMTAWLQDGHEQVRGHNTALHKNTIASKANSLKLEHPAMVEVHDSDYQYVE